MKGKVSRISRGILVGVSSALILGVFPAVAHAEPSATDLRSQISNLNEDAEKQTEKYNAAVEERDKHQREADAANVKIKEIDGTLQKTGAKLRGLVAASYKNAPEGDLTAVFTSKSPEDILNQLAIMDLLARRRNVAVAGVLDAKKKAEDERSKANEALAAAKKLTDELDKQKKQIQAKIDDLTKKLNSLTAADRASVLSPGSVTAPITNILAPNPKAQTAVNAAMSKLGSDYVWAAAGPNVFDCSGLTMWAWAQAGVTITRNSANQYATLPHVPASQRQPGDLVFFYSPIHHVGMYIGNGKMVHAPQTGDVVKVTDVSVFGSALTGYARPA